MSKEVKKGLVPDLRFPEFAPGGEWKEKMLDEISNVIASGDLDSKSFSLLETNQHIYPIYSNSISNEGLYGYSSYAKYKKNSVTITARGTLGFAFVRVSDFFGIGRLLVVSDLKEVDAVFLKENWNYFAKISVENGGIPQLTAIKAKSITLKFPKLEEQQKIADCLSSLDELITANSEKLEALKDHKKGLMQQLFPANGKKIPELRFEGFEDSGEWLVEPLSKIYSFITTSSLPRDNLNYEEGDVKNIHYGDIHTKFSALFDITKERVPFINSSISLEKTRVENYCKEGDIIFADASEDLKDIGKMIELVNLNNEKLLSGLHTLHARQGGSKLVVGFAGHLFVSNSIRRQIQREAQGSKVLSISVPRISNISITYPKDKKEQKKIADLLTSLDEVISEEAQKINGLKTHKKGLMQGLFPSVNNINNG